MFLLKVLGFWLLVGMALAGWRRWGKRKELQILRVTSPLDGRQR